MAKLDEVLKVIPEFIKKLEKAKSESAIAKACQQMKDTVDKIFDKAEGRRDTRSMAAIRKAVNERFPTQPVNDEVASAFPYYFTDRGVGKINRLEHLAIKYLKDDRNPQTDWSDVEVKPEVEEVKPVITADVSLESFGLSDEELAVVNQAIGDADVREWVKQAIMQRANAINKLRESLDEDWASIPSEVLMNDKKYRTNSGACRELVNRAVRVIKQWNYDHPEHKWCLTNKLISELTGITVKAIAKAVEGMDNESYNKGQDLEPVINRLTRAAVGEPKEVMSIAKVTGTEGSEVNYHPEKAIAP
jgi:hypothetical protein